MTDYNDGLWHGWNGGECPVHPKSSVEAVFRSQVTPPFSCSIRPAASWDWSAPASFVVAFRVIKPYREPRVWWIVLTCYGDTWTTCPTEEAAKRFVAEGSNRSIVRVVEQPE